MLSVRFFPTVLIVLDFAASISYGLDRDWRLSVYWFAAGVLTICVTY